MHGIHDVTSWGKKYKIKKRSNITGAVCQEDEPDNISRNYLIQFLLWLLGRLADNLRWQDKDLGGDILSDATNSTLLMVSIGCSHAFAVHDLSGCSKHFYEHFGFRPFVPHSMDLMISLKEADATTFG